MKCHSKASVCVDREIGGQCYCDNGYSGDGINFCDGKYFFLIQSSLWFRALFLIWDIFCVLFNENYSTTHLSTHKCKNLKKFNHFEAFIYLEESTLECK